MEQKKLEGFLLINKPTGITSFDCIRHIRKIIGRSVKIGHAGTLDPFASGLLIIALSRTATREINKLETTYKRYAARAKLGELTDTLDPTGTVLTTCPINHITRESLEQACQKLQPEYIQIPPIYSALKYKGAALYALIKDNKMSHDELEAIAVTKQRIVTLKNIDITEYKSPYFSIDATVSGGTYIRSLMNDLARKLNSCATTITLERTAIGPFSLANSCTLNQLSTYDDIQNHLFSVDEYIKQLLN